MIYYRDDVGEALARARTGCEDVVVARSGDLNGFGLVAVEPEVLAGIVRSFACPEDAGALPVQDAVGHQFVYAFACLEGGVKLYQGIGPEEALVEPLPDLLLDARVFKPDKASDVGAVIVDQAIA